MPEVRYPPQIEQAKEAVRDDPNLRDLKNIVYGLDGVTELFADGEDEDWRPTVITIGFEDYDRTSDVVDIMAIAGWRVERVVFTYQRIEFIRRGDADE